MLSEQGEVLASAPVDITAAGQWNDLSLAMQPTATSAKGKLALEFDAPGTVYVDYVSLFPEKTFHDRPNGLRKDVAEILEGLHPRLRTLAPVAVPPLQGSCAHFTQKHSKVNNISMQKA